MFRSAKFKTHPLSDASHKFKLNPFDAERTLENAFRMILFNIWFEVVTVNSNPDQYAVGEIWIILNQIDRLPIELSNSLSLIYNRNSLQFLAN